MKRQVVTFTVGEEEYAIDIATIIEIIYFRKAVPIPQAPEFIDGVIDLRGRVIPVLDARKRLGLKDRGAVPHHILVLRVEERDLIGRHEQVLGVVVDEVTGVTEIDEKRIQKPQDAYRTEGSGYLLGVCKMKDGILFLLDPGSLLTSEETAALGGIHP